MVLAMLRALPEDASFTAHMKVENEKEADPDGPPSPVEIDPELAAFADKKVWTEDRKLLADISNRLGTILRYLHQWEPGKEPKLPIIGPQEWRAAAEADEPQKLVTIDDVLGMFTRSG